MKSENNPLLFCFFCPFDMLRRTFFFLKPKPRIKVSCFHACFGYKELEIYILKIVFLNLNVKEIFNLFILK